ncbi:hypothetical protein [Labrenzia sp. OB1]|uniref:hypothetical protein n=1 Tax=Labrenzia sp. OB1 TaxID=1561204 RepID=UPI0012E8077F|nr:hypothetical protein [Labrenzia sp. OB1]
MSVVIAPVFAGVDVFHIERFAIELNRLMLIYEFPAQGGRERTYPDRLRQQC